VYHIPTAGSTVVLAAGAICSARIALNSGIQRWLPLTGKGLMDHPIYDVRFARRTKRKSEPMNLRAMINICDTIGLLTVTVNNDFFFAGSANASIEQFLNADGSTIKPETAYKSFASDDEVFDTIAIVLEFGMALADENEVLTHACPDPIIRVRRNQTYSDETSQAKLQALATKIRNEVIQKYLPKIDVDAGQPEENVTPTEAAPRMVLRGFGLVAHEVGTLRMDSPQHPRGVVDSGLKVHGLSNLYCCDLSVFPYSTPANPALTLSALSLRLADRLKEEDSHYRAGDVGSHA